MQVRTARLRRVHARLSQAAVSGSGVGKSVIVGDAVGARVGRMGGSGLPAVNLYPSDP
jgi:hypothetical protein